MALDRRSGTLAFALLAFVAGAFANARASASTDIASVVLARHGCYGTCPVYEVRIARNGDIDYTGYSNVTKVGKYHGSVSTTAFDDIVRKIRAGQQLPPRAIPRYRIVDGELHTLAAETDDGTAIDAGTFPQASETDIEHAVDAALHDARLEETSPIQKLAGAYESIGPAEVHRATLRYSLDGTFQLYEQTIERDSCNGLGAQGKTDVIPLLVQADGTVHGSSDPVTIRQDASGLHVLRPGTALDLTPETKNVRDELLRDPTTVASWMRATHGRGPVGLSAGRSR